MSRRFRSPAPYAAASPPVPPLKFAGSVAIAAADSRVWSLITDPDALGRFTPGFVHADRVSPTRYRVTHTLPFGSDPAPLVTAVEWVTVEPPRRLALVAHSTIGGQQLRMTGDLALNGGSATELAFAAAFHIPPTWRNVPRHILRPIITRTITTFFQNLKESAETS